MENCSFWPHFQLQEKNPSSCPYTDLWMAYFELSDGKDSQLSKDNVHVTQRDEVLD